VKKLNLTQQKQTSQEQDGNNTQNKPIAKENLNQQSTTCLCVRKGAIKWVVVMSVIVGSSKSANFIYMLLAYNTHTQTPFYGLISRTTRVSRCWKKSSWPYGAREDNRQTQWPSGWVPLHLD